MWWWLLAPRLSSHCIDGGAEAAAAAAAAGLLAEQFHHVVFAVYSAGEIDLRGCAFAGECARADAFDFFAVGCFVDVEFGGAG